MLAAANHAVPRSGRFFRRVCYISIAMARKLIGFDPETLRALELLSSDSGRSLRQLADEAFSDLLSKYHRPRTFVDVTKAKRATCSRQ
jgi:hypothetical protein